MGNFFKILFGLDLKGSVDPGDRLAIKDSTVGSGDPDRNILLSTLSTWLAGVLEFISGIVLTSGRIAFQERQDDVYTSPGWYTVAEIADGSVLSASGEITCHSSTGGQILGVKFAFRSSNVARSLDNSTFELSKMASDSGNMSILSGFKLVYGDSDAGLKIQINLIADPGALVSQIVNNLSRFNTLKGAELVEPYLDDSPDTPDGTPAVGFLEAGEELNIQNEAVDILKVKKISNDILVASILWPEIPKTGTGMVITLPTTSLTVRDGANTISTITGAHSISNFKIQGKLITFRINEVGVATSINSGPLAMLWSGTGGKLTIT